MYLVLNNELYRISSSTIYPVNHIRIKFLSDSRHLKHSVTLDIHRYPTGTASNSGVPNRDVLSLLSSTGTVSTEDSSTCSDSSISYRSHRLKQMPLTNPNRNFVDLAQLGHYVEPKPLIRQATTTSALTAQPFYEMTNSSMLAVKGSPTNTFV